MTPWRLTTSHLGRCAQLHLAKSKKQQRPEETKLRIWGVLSPRLVNNTHGEKHAKLILIFSDRAELEIRISESRSRHYADQDQR